ncbi:hypothetical protein MUBE_01030 [Mycobacterium uberis]|uniref:DUF881 domain-containing protein n=1 Tax=Mycobacterium uberis TaxID=2162698 RepID=A0A3E1HL52_9MYCO|nr:DUF881 domain-containing protein [Mycobacterium uberis]RFD27230.1 hypothetical protein MUBE_01030 [Mycobacterium uberis]
MIHKRCSPWCLSVPLVNVLAGLLLATTHGVSGGTEIRRSDAPRLVNLVRAAQSSVSHLSNERDAMTSKIDTTHNRFSDAALATVLRQSGELVGEPDMDPVHGPGLVVTLEDAQRDANGHFPRDASPDDLVVHQQDIQAVMNAVWSAGAEAIQMQDQRVITTSVARCVGNTLLLNGRTYSPPYTIIAIGNAAAMQAALAAAPRVILYKQYVVRFGLGYHEEIKLDVQVVGYSEPVRTHFAQPMDPFGH